MILNNFDHDREENKASHKLNNKLNYDKLEKLSNWLLNKLIDKIIIIISSSYDKHFLHVFGFDVPSW